MTTPHTTTHGAAAARPAEALARPAATPAFEWTAALLGAWVVIGLYLDGWAHSHGRLDDVFFTPWHAVLYSGAAAMMLFLGLSLGRGLARGRPWRRALPGGYGLSLLGAALFALGGLGDMAWHLAFGVEAGVEALLSPSHLFLALGGILMFTGPLRAAWSRRAPASQGWARLGPAVISAALFLAALTFFTAYAHPLGHEQTGNSTGAWAAAGLGVASVLVQSGLLMGLVLPLAQRRLLPPGALTLILGSNAALMSVLGDRYALVPAAVLAGLLADGLVWAVRPHPARRPAWLAFAALVPALHYALYFAALALGPGLRWSIHLWGGAVVLAGAAGLLLALNFTSGEARPAPAD